VWRALAAAAGARRDANQSTRRKPCLLQVLPVLARCRCSAAIATAFNLPSEMWQEADESFQRIAAASVTCMTKQSEMRELLTGLLEEFQSRMNYGNDFNSVKYR
jgi:hypothetical protein